jgi:hypothetical protein
MTLSLAVPVAPLVCATIVWDPSESALASGVVQLQEPSTSLTTEQIESPSIVTSTSTLGSEVPEIVGVVSSVRVPSVGVTITRSVHVVPSPVQPASHSQVNDPGKLVQDAAASQSAPEP